jgi:hypothetical protein
LSISTCSGRYSVEKKKIKDVLLAGQNKKYFITELDNEKFKVSKLTLIY